MGPQGKEGRGKVEKSLWGVQLQQTWWEQTSLNTQCLGKKSKQAEQGADAKGAIYATNNSFTL